MAKSSKPTTRKRAPSKSAKAAKEAVIDAEVVSDASDAAKAVTEDVAENVTGDAADSLKANESDAAEDVSDAASDNAANTPDDKTPDLNTSDDPVSEPSETEAQETLPAPTPEPARGGLFGSVLGGVIAGALGFGASMLIFPDGWRAKDDSALTALQATVDEQQGALSGVSDSLGTLQGQLESGIDASTQADDALAVRIDETAVRIDELTQSDGTVELPDDLQILLNAQRDEISSLQSEVAEMAAAAKSQMQAAAAQQETAEEAEARVKARGAMQQVRLALLSGEPFAEALNEVAPAVDLPEGLAAVAQDGAPTSADLNAAFPAAARKALSVAVRETAGDDTQSRLKLFLQDQLSARSLSPQEGDSADAVLSRVEAAVKSEDYQAALDEMDALPDSAKSELADWRALAEARLGAVNGFDAVTDALNGN